MASLSDLATRMQKLAVAIPNNVNELKKKIALTIENDLVYVTPVDTSQALSNWTVSLIPLTSDSFRAPYYPGEQGSTRGPSAQEAIDAAQAVLAGVKAGQAVYVGNAAPYIQRLDEGYSSQEPAGFVSRAILLGRKVVESAQITKG